MPPDPSAFFRVNEEVARELERLDRSGALEPLRALLEGSGAELWVSAAKPKDGLEELVGILRPGPRTGARRAPVMPLPPVATRSDDAGCSCGTPEDNEEQAAEGDAAGGWDHAGVLATRSRFVVELPDGSAREVYMPDHVCPSCFSDEENQIDGCARVCARCAFRW
jgi:hypothetical protein